MKLNPEMVSGMATALESARLSVNDTKVAAAWVALGGESKRSLAWEMYAAENPVGVDQNATAKFNADRDLYDAKARAELRLLMEQKVQEAVVQRAIVGAQDGESFITAALVAKDWIETTRPGPSVTPVRVSPNLTARNIINTSLRLATRGEGVDSEVIDATAELIVDQRTNASTSQGELLANYLYSDVRRYTARTINSLGKFDTTHPLEQTGPQAKAAAIALTEQLMQRGMVDKSFWYSQATGPAALSTDPMYVYKLYECLSGKGEFPADEYYPGERNTPERYFDDVADIITGVIKRAADPDGMDSQNGRVILQNIKQQGAGQRRSSYADIIRVGAALTENINNAGGVTIVQDGQAQNEKIRLPQLDTKKVSIGDVPEAFRRMLYVIHGRNSKNPELQNEDTLWAEVVELIMDHGLEMKDAQKVWTLGELAVRFRGASPMELQRITEQMQQGSSIHEAHEWFRDVRQETRFRAFHYRNRPGFGALS